MGFVFLNGILRAWFNSENVFQNVSGHGINNNLNELLKWGMKGGEVMTSLILDDKVFCLAPPGWEHTYWVTVWIYRFCKALCSFSWRKKVQISCSALPAEAFLAPSLRGHCFWRWCWCLAAEFEGLRSWWCFWIWPPDGGAWCHTEIS